MKPIQPIRAINASGNNIVDVRRFVVPDSAITQGSETVTISGGSVAIGDTVTGATQGSVLFAGAAGVLAQDNANLFYDSTGKTLRVIGGLVGDTANQTLTLSSTTGSFLTYNNTNYFQAGSGAVSIRWGAGRVLTFNTSGSDFTMYCDVNDTDVGTAINPFSRLFLSPRVATYVPLSIKLAAAQSADAFQVYASDGTTKLASILAGGSVNIADTQSYQVAGANLLSYSSGTGSVAVNGQGVTGLLLTGGSYIRNQIGAAVVTGTTASGFAVTASTQLGFVPSTDTTVAMDAGFARSAAGVIIPTNGGAGAGGFLFRAGTATLAPQVFTAGTVLTSPVAGAVEFDGTTHFRTIDTTSGRGMVPVDQYVHLTAAGSTISTIANYFGANSNISLVANAYYEIDIYAFFLNTTAGTVTWTFTNSAAPTGQNIEYEASPVTGMVALGSASASDLTGQVYNDTTAAFSFTTGTLTTAVNHYARFKIILKNGTGTSLKIQATKNVGGTITPGIGSYWRCRRISAGNVGTLAA